jgi:hypothetical protein
MIMVREYGMLLHIVLKERQEEMHWYKRKPEEGYSVRRRSICDGGEEEREKRVRVASNFPSGGWTYTRRERPPTAHLASSHGTLSLGVASAIDEQE